MGARRRHDRRGVVLGATFEELIQEDLGEPWLIAVMLAVFGVVLWWVDRRMRSDRDLTTIGPAYRPVPRHRASARPAAGHLAVGDHDDRGAGDRPGPRSAARFSFLLSIPIVPGPACYKGLDLVRHGLPGIRRRVLLGVRGRGDQRVRRDLRLLTYLGRHEFAVFMWYRLGVAALAFALVATGVREATI